MEVGSRASAPFAINCLLRSHRSPPRGRERGKGAAAGQGGIGLRSQALRARRCPWAIGWSRCPVVVVSAIPGSGPSTQWQTTCARGSYPVRRPSS